MDYSLDQVKALAMPVSQIFGQTSMTDVSLARVRFWSILDQIPDANKKFTKLLSENPHWKTVMERHNCTLAGHPKIYFDLERRHIPAGYFTHDFESELNLFILDNRYPVLQVIEYERVTVNSL